MEENNVRKVDSDAAFFFSTIILLSDIGKNVLLYDSEEDSCSPIIIGSGVVVTRLLFLSVSASASKFGGCGCWGI